MSQHIMKLSINAHLPQGQACFYAGDVISGVLHAEVRKSFTIGSLSIA
jgi:hypothetical protein